MSCFYNFGSCNLYIIWFLQETLDELANASGTEFEIPENFDEQVLVSIALMLNLEQPYAPAE